MFYLRSCLVGFFGFSIAVFRFHALYAVGPDVHIKVTHEHKTDATCFSLTIGQYGRTSTVSFKASDNVPKAKNSGSEESFELDLGNGFSVPVPPRQDEIAFNIIPNVLQIRVVRTDRSITKTVLNAFSGIKPQDVRFIMLIAAYRPGGISTDIDLCVEADLPVIYSGRFNSVRMHHPLYCYNSDGDISDTFFECKFLFCEDGEWMRPPTPDDDGYARPEYMSVVLSNKCSMFSTPSYQWICSSVEDFANYEKMKRMVVSEKGEIISRRETVRNREYFGFICLWTRNDGNKDLSDRSLLVTVKAVNKDNCTKTVGQGHLIPRGKEPNPFVVFFCIPKPFPNKDENFALPKELSAFTLRVCNGGGGTLKDGYGISVDDSGNHYPIYCIFEGK